MRISELSKRSGIPIPTIKYYLREGILPAGEATKANQASYGDDHVARLRLIRALIEVGGLSVASTKDVLEAADAPGLPLGWVFGAAQNAISQPDLHARPVSDAGLERIDELIERRGWRVTGDNPWRVGAAGVVDSFTATGHPELLDLVDDYAAAAEIVARADLRAVARHPDVASMASTVVVGTVLGDAMFAALRRIAQEHATFEQFPAPESDDPFGRTTATPDRRTP